MPSSTSVTTAASAPGASRLTVTHDDAPEASPSAAIFTFAETFTGISFSTGRTLTVVCPCARTAMWRAFASTLCTTERYTSRFGASSRRTGSSSTSEVALVSTSTLEYRSFSRITERSAWPANGDFTTSRGVSPTR